MKTNILLFFAICVTFAVCVSESQAKTFAYLIGSDGSIMKIDTDTDAIVFSSKLEKSSHVQDGERSVAADKVNNYLFVVTGRMTPSIYVYDLKTLKFIKDIGIKSDNPEVSILVSPNGKQLFINWFEKDGWLFDLYDAKSLSKISNLGEFVWGPVTTFSSDGSKVYVYSNKKMKAYETADFTLINTTDLDTIWKVDGFLSEIEDYKNEKILIIEIKKIIQGASPQITYFVFDLNTKTSSTRITTDVAGDSKLSPDGTRFFVNDENSVWSSDNSYVMYKKSAGKLYVYDVINSNIMGSIQFTVDRESNIMGVHPSGNKVYLKGDISGVRSLISMDIVNFKVINTIKIPENVLFMIFFNE